MRRHDPFLKLLYRAGARDAVSLFFPDLASTIDWRRLRWIEKEVAIPGDRPRSVIADLVGMTRDVEGRYLEVLIHPEIQGRPDPEMGARVLEYNAALWLQQGNRKARVLSFVFYHCRGTGGIQKHRYALEYYGHAPLAAEYWSVGLGELAAAEYMEADNPMAWALAGWMRQEREGRAEQRLELQARILRFVRDESYRRLLLDSVRTYFTLSRTEQHQERELLRSGAYGDVREEMLTELGKLEQKARREARREALQEAVLAFVQARFGTVPENLEAHVRRLRDVDRLQELVRRAGTAASPQDVWPEAETGTG